MKIQIDESILDSILRTSDEKTNQQFLYQELIKNYCFSEFYNLLKKLQDEEIVGDDVLGLINAGYIYCSKSQETEYSFKISENLFLCIE